MKDKKLNLSLPDRCCTAETGCHFDGSLRNVVSEPIYVQKVYDAALLNSQALVNAMDVEFSPSLGANARILRVLDIRCKKYFNPDNIKDPDNLKVNSMTEISGGQLVKEETQCGPRLVRRVGPDGERSEFLVYADTSECDEDGKGTPIFGTQRLSIEGNVIIEIDVLFTDDCDKECEATLYATVPVNKEGPIMLTNFFELCIPSVFDGAFLPRFTEFCNINCETRLATNNIKRDLKVDECGNVTGNLLIALCITCEKKIVVPVQLCVLSTGFPVLSPSINQVCSSFPTLFPKQIDEESDRRHCGISESEE